VETGLCGNQSLDQGEECDDGNILRVGRLLAELFGGTIVDAYPLRQLGRRVRLHGPRVRLHGPRVRLRQWCGGRRRGVRRREPLQRRWL
jgi:hypothetical protein